MADSLIIAPHENAGLTGGMASVMARKGVNADRLAERLGIAIPQGPKALFSGTCGAIGIGPGNWLLIAEAAGPDFAETLQNKLSGLASVSDQSSSYVIHRLAGKPARTLLQRGAAMDFDPSCFTTGDAAVTMIAHIGVIIWQRDDAPTYDIATFRSYAGSFRHWLSQTSAALPEI